MTDISLEQLESIINKLRIDFPDDDIRLHWVPMRKEREKYYNDYAFDFIKGVVSGLPVDSIAVEDDHNRVPEDCARMLLYGLIHDLYVAAKELKELKGDAQ